MGTTPESSSNNNFIPPKTTSSPPTSLFHNELRQGGVSVPQAHDVLCGRGGAVNNHPGNEAYRRIVAHNKKWYVLCLKHHKILLSRSIVEAIYLQNPPGRFLAQGTDELWHDIGYKKAIEKTSQALREGAVEVRRRHRLLLDGENSAEVEAALENNAREAGPVPGIDRRHHTKKRTKNESIFYPRDALFWDGHPPTKLDGVIAVTLASLARRGASVQGASIEGASAQDSSAQSTSQNDFPPTHITTTTSTTTSTKKSTAAPAMTTQEPDGNAGYEQTQDGESQSSNDSVTTQSSNVSDL